METSIDPTLAAIVAATDQFVPTDLWGQIKAADEELAEALEQYRHPLPPSDVPVHQHREFVAAAGKIIAKRAKAEERLRQIDPDAELPKHPAPAPEIWGLMQQATLQRAGAVAWLRSERVRLLAVYKPKHAQLVADIEAAARYYAHPGQTYEIVTRDMRDGDDNSDLAITLRRVAPWVTELAIVERRLDDLDHTADFAAAVAQAMHKAGGPVKVATACKAALLAGNGWYERSSRYTAIRQESAAIAQLEQTLRVCDPDSRKAVNNRAQLAAAAERLASLKTSADHERTVIVAELLDKAAAGDVASADQLENLVRTAPAPFTAGFGDALAAARCSDRQLPGVVSALI
jgi:hypothetical protein